MPRLKSLRGADLQDACGVLEVTVVRRQLATTAELAAHRPGGRENPDPGPRGWLRWHGMLQHWVLSQDLAPAAPMDLEALFNRVATAEPIEVTTSLLDEAGAPRILHVHPKSRRALLILAAREARYRAYGDRFRHLQARHTAETLPLLPRVADAIDYQLRCLCWSVTHPGPWLPYDPQVLDPPDPPAWCSLLSQLDTVALLLAHQRVSLEPSRLLSQMLGGIAPSSAGPATLGGWGIFVTQAAAEQGLELDVLDRDRSLPQVLLQVLARAQAAEDARRAAEAAP